jgi:hypothetical protein
LEELVGASGEGLVAREQARPGRWPVHGTRDRLPDDLGL